LPLSTATASISIFFVILGRERLLREAFEGVLEVMQDMSIEEPHKIAGDRTEVLEA
jgi:hypothetical protein